MSLLNDRVTSLLSNLVKGFFAIKNVATTNYGLQLASRHLSEDSALILDVVATSPEHILRGGAMSSSVICMIQCGYSVSVRFFSLITS
jgi:hypothetical protein